MNNDILKFSNIPGTQRVQNENTLLNFKFKIRPRVVYLNKSKVKFIAQSGPIGAGYHLFDLIFKGGCFFLLVFFVFFI